MTVLSELSDDGLCLVVGGLEQPQGEDDTVEGIYETTRRELGAWCDDATEITWLSSREMMPAAVCSGTVYVPPHRVSFLSQRGAMGERPTVEEAMAGLREVHRKVNWFRENWWVFRTTSELIDSCGTCYCGHSGRLVLKGGTTFPVDEIVCERCQIDRGILRKLFGAEGNAELFRAVAARRRREEQEASGGEDLYFLEGEAYRDAVLALCLKTLAKHEADLVDRRRTWKPNCYCEDGENYCGDCEACGAQGHTQHFPGPLPYTGGWCDECSLEISFLVEAIGMKYGTRIFNDAARARREMKAGR